MPFPHKFTEPSPSDKIEGRENEIETFEDRKPRGTYFYVIQKPKENRINTEPEEERRTREKNPSMNTDHRMKSIDIFCSPDTDAAGGNPLATASN